MPLTVISDSGISSGGLYAIFAVIGMIVGGAVYAELYLAATAPVLAWKNHGKIGLPKTPGVSNWVIIPIFWAGTIALFAWFERKKL